MEKEKNQDKKVPILDGLPKTFLQHPKRVPDEAIKKVGETFCDHCGSIGIPLGIYDTECLILRCGNCEHHGWASCIRCKVRKNMLTIGQWARHKRNTHNTKNKRKSVEAMTSTADVMDVTDDRNSTFADTDEVEDQPEHTEEPELSKWTDIFGKNGGLRHNCNWRHCSVRGDCLGFEQKSNSAAFFQQDFLAEDGVKGGIDYLVKRSLLVGSHMEASQYRASHFVVPEGHAELQMKIAELAFGLSPREKSLTVKVLRGAHRLGEESGDEKSKLAISAKFDHRMMKARNSDFEKNYILNQIAPECLAPEIVPAPRDTVAWGTRIPDDVNEMRRLYLEGANSIVQNLPHPSICTDVAGHSYLSITDCIRDFFAHKEGCRVAIIPEHVNEAIPDCITHTSESPRAQEILRQLSIAGEPSHAVKSYVFFWSDDVEPNRLSKAGRGSVWVATMTIATQSGDAHNLRNTYPIAIGKKGDSHDKIIARIEKEMRALRKGEFVYVGALKKQIRMQFSDMAQLSDQPERRGINFLRLGGRGFTARFGVSANHFECYDNIRACRDCNETNKQRLRDGDHMVSIPNCERCMNWDVLAEGRLGLATPPDNYPILRDEAQVVLQPNAYEASPYCRLVRTSKSDQKLRPFRISYASLKGAIELAHECYCSHGWSSHNVSAYLKVEGLNDEFISMVLEHATRAYSLKTARAAPANDEFATYYTTVLKDAERFPEKYERVPYPAAWNRDGFELQSYPDVIMHLIFLGIVDDTMQLTQNWLKATKRNTAFIKANAYHLEALTRMDIQWINVLRYTGEGFGHWVSENYLGFARVMPWFYQNIEAVAPEEIVLPPESTQKGWTKKQNEHWLKCRGLDTTGSAVELRRRVEENMAKKEPPPVVQEPIRKVRDVEGLMVALYNLLECLMSTTITQSTIGRTRYAVRVFLSAYHTLHASVKGESSSIFSIFNLACLMNLPDAMQQFGPLRQLWEGATKGEGILRFVKPMMTQGFKHQLHWHYHLLQKLSISKAFRNVLPDPELGIDSLADSLSSRKGLFHKHKSLYDFQRDLSATHMSSKKPISVLVTKTTDGKAQVIAVVDTYDKIMRIEQSASTAPKQKFGLHYYRFEARDQNNLVPWGEFSEDVEEIGYGLLLPMLANGTESSQMFALIGSNWKTLSPSTALVELIDSASATFN